MQHLLSQNKQLLNHVQQLTEQLQKLQELQQQAVEEAGAPQNSNSNNNKIEPLVISDNNSETSSSSKSDSPDFHTTTDQLRVTDSPQATNPLFEFPSDEMNIESRLLPGDPFLVDPFNSSSQIASGDSS